MALLSCTVAIKDTKLCSVAGELSAGGICSHLLTDETEDMTFEQFLEFLEANRDRGAAVCMPAQGFSDFKTSLEVACRLLGTKCTYEVKKAIKQMKFRLKQNELYSK